MLFFITTSSINAQKLPYEFYFFNDTRSSHAINLRLTNLYITDVHRLHFSYHHEFEKIGVRYISKNTVTADFSHSRHLAIIRKSVLNNLYVGIGASLGHLSAEEKRMLLVDPCVFASLEVNQSSNLQFLALNLANQGLEGTVLSWCFKKTFSPQLSMNASISGTTYSWPEMNVSWYYQSATPWSISLSINANPFYTGFGIYYSIGSHVIGSGTFYDFRLGSSPFMHWSGSFSSTSTLPFLPGK